MIENIIPNFEDKILECLDGELKQTALNFINYLKENQFRPLPATCENSYKIPYDGKNLCKVWVNPNEIQFHFWFGDYSGDFYDDFKTAVQERVGFCDVCHAECTGPFDVSIFGKELKNVCSQHTIAFTNPDNKTLEYIIMMIEYSKKIVPDSVSYHAHN